MKFQIKEARERAGFSQRELAEIIGVAPNTFHGYESGKHAPTSHLIAKIAQACGTTVDYLLGISNDPYGTHSATIRNFDPHPYSESALKIARDYDALDAQWQHIVGILFKAIATQAHKTQQVMINDDSKVIHLPEPIQAASAGTGEFADDDTNEQVAVLYNKWTAKADYIMRVHGDSMEPQIHDGDRVLVREQPSVRLGETGVFIRGGDRFIKIYRGDHLESANPAYQDIGLDEDSRCIGKVIGVLNPDWVVGE